MSPKTSTCAQLRSPPTEVSTTDVKQSTDKLERVAQAVHEGWREYQLARGRVYGSERTASTHPHLVAWAELEAEAQNQDKFIAALLLRLWIEKRLQRSSLPAAIHDSWVVWEQVNGKSHPHAKAFAVAHSHGAEEHDLQATKIASILEELEHDSTD